MKEYIGQTGGRYTYTEDLHYIQELANSSNEILNEFGNLIVSGCNVSEGKINKGFVFINGKMRKFSGKTDIKFPCYIYEKNKQETVNYANEQSKVGRINYGCELSQDVPTEIIDDVTKKNVEYITITSDDRKNPTLKNVFFGKHAVLNSPSNGKQNINGDVTFNGSTNVKKRVNITESISVGGDGNLKVETVAYKDSVDVGYYDGSIRTKVMSVKKDGTVTLFGELGDITIKGGVITVPELRVSDMKINKTGIARVTGRNGDALKINADTGGSITGFEVFDGKSQMPYIQYTAGEDKVSVHKNLNVSGSINAIDGENTHTSENFSASSSLLDKSGTSVFSVIANNKSINLNSYQKNITVSPNKGNGKFTVDGHVDILGSISDNGKLIKNIYVTKEDFNEQLKSLVTQDGEKGLSDENFTTELKEKLEGIETATVDDNSSTGFVVSADVNKKLLDLSKGMVNKVDRVDGKTLTSNDFTDEQRDKLNSIETSTIDSGSDKGYVLAKDAKEHISTKLQNDKKLKDLILSDEIEQREVCRHIGASFASDTQAKMKDTGWLRMIHPLHGEMAELYVRQIGSLVSIQGEIPNSKDQVKGVFAKLPNEISSPKATVASNLNMWLTSKQGNSGKLLGLKGGTRNLIELDGHGYNNDRLYITITYLA